MTSQNLGLGNDNPEIISRKPFSGLLGPNDVSAILGKRAQRQFGVGLSQDEKPNIGIGGDYIGSEKDEAGRISGKL